MATQLEISRSGKISDEMKFVAESENLDTELVREQLSQGLAVIPANRLHIGTNLNPRGIGRVFSTKVNANIGTSSVRSSV